MAEITKSYEPREVEKRWYGAWQAAGAFRPAAGAGAYTIVMPPPNVTGVLTMGHVLNNTLQDILVRRGRLEGRPALWIPGTDHAGIATQTVVERELRKEKRHRRDLGRDKFLERVWAWRREKGDIILEQLKALGCSCDWERARFTMDPAYSRAVLEGFVRLFRAGRIYRGKRMVNWCPASQTALSDEEVIMKPVAGTLYEVRYELADRPGEYVHVATTRPETIPGDVAIAVHPEDPRYAALVGRTVWRPINRAPIPIVADAAVDREFGSGALKITPAHDKADFEIGLRHGLPVIDVLEADGTLNALAGPGLAGLDRFAGRRKAVELLTEAGAFVGDKPHQSNVGYSERAGVPIEPRLTWQWWLRYPRVEEAKRAVRDGHIRFFPERWSKVYLHWLENIQDWCISRQLWWGHRIPVWSRTFEDDEALKKGLRHLAHDLGPALQERGAFRADGLAIHVATADPELQQSLERLPGFVQDPDVLDTWASSWIWPLATLGWPDGAAMAREGFDRFYPTSTLVTGPDIIFFWVARMIMAGLEFDGGAPAGRALSEGEIRDRVPFRKVYFTGIIRDALGRKMSKSLGNSPDPLDLIAKYGADGLRFGIVSIAPQGQDIRFQEERIEGGKNFCNKLWNAARFRQKNGPMADNSSLEAVLRRLERPRFDADDFAVLVALVATVGEVERCFAEFEFSAATQAIYGFFWNDFCDWYVEVSKARLESPEARANCLAVQDLVLRQTLLLLAPFVPFIAEELWSLLGYGGPGSLLQRDARVETATGLGARLAEAVGSGWEAAAASVQAMKTFVSQARALKAEHNLASRRDVRFFLKADEAGWKTTEDNLAKLLRVAGAAEIARRESVDGAPAVVTPLGTLYLDLASAVDAGAEKQRLEKELEKLSQHIAGTEARLANPAFAGKAPAAVIDGAKKQLADLRAKRAETERLLKALGQAPKAAE